MRSMAPTLAAFATTCFASSPNSSSLLPPQGPSLPQIHSQEVAVKVAVLVTFGSVLVCAYSSVAGCYAVDNENNAALNTFFLDVAFVWSLAQRIETVVDEVLRVIVPCQAKL